LTSSRTITLMLGSFQELSFQASAKALFINTST
jgi:hypothetical protein